MISTRVKRQLAGKAIKPQNISGFAKGVPEVHEIQLGNFANTTALSNQYVYLKYISPTNPFKLYKMKLYAQNVLAVAGTNIYAGLYTVSRKASSASTGIPDLKLVAAADAAHTADYTGGGASLPTNMGTFTFSKEPLMLPGFDYYLAIYGDTNGTVTVTYWCQGNLTDCIGVLKTGLTSMPDVVTPIGVSGSFPGVILQSKRGDVLSGA